MRRGLVIGLAVVLAGVSTLAAPAVANASVYVHEVRFPGSVDCDDSNVAIGATAWGSSPTLSGNKINTVDQNHGSWWESSTGLNGRFLEIDLAAPADICGIRIVHAAWGSSGTLTGVTVTHDVNCSAAGGLTGSPSFGPFGAGPRSTLVDSGFQAWELPGAECFRLVVSGTATGSWQVFEVEIYGNADENPPCYGQAGAGAGSGLIWGAADLTSETHTGWGDRWVDAHDACLFDRPGTYRWMPNVVPGHTFTMGVEARAYPGTVGRASFFWLLCEIDSDTDVRAIQRINVPWEYRGLDQTAVDAPKVTVDAPGTACGIAVVIGENTLLRAVYIADHEGDPVLDGGEYPSSEGGDDSTEDLDAWFADCDPPEDPLDVPGWLSFGACLVEMGFRMVVDWIGKVVAAVGTNVGGFIGDVIVPGLDGIAGAFGSVLDFLFVPDDIGADWAAFLDLAETRVPFVYVAEVAGAVDDIDSSMAGSAAVFSFTLMGAPVSFDAVGLSDDLDIVRPALAGLVWLGLAWTVFHRVGAALGVSRSESSSVQSG